MTGEHAALIGLDWGTTSFRAYRIDAAGRVLEQRERDAGILKVQDGDFAGTLPGSIGDWLAAAPDLPVLAAGMIGSRQGWLEVPYVALPRRPAGAGARGSWRCRPRAAARRARARPDRLRAAEGFPDVMRGEETQILGDLAASRDAGPPLLRPARHAQQVGLVRGRPDRALRHLHDRRALRRPGPPQHPGPADGAGRARRRRLRRGLDARAGSAGAAPGELLHDLFSARTLGLIGEPAAAGTGQLSERPADRRRSRGGRRAGPARDHDPGQQQPRSSLRRALRPRRPARRPSARPMRAARGFTPSPRPRA